MKIAVRAPPTWRKPVGLGANRTRTEPVEFIALPILVGSEILPR